MPTTPRTHACLTLLIAFIGTLCGSPSAAANDLDDAIEGRPGWLFNKAEQCPTDLKRKREVQTVALYEYCEPDLQGCFRKCKRSDANACYSLALVLEREERHPNAVKAMYHRACLLGVSSGCTNFAVRLAPEEPCAVRTFDMACERDDPWGCAMLGWYLLQGNGTDVDEERAKGALRKACNKHGDADPACQNAKQVLDDLTARDQRR